MFNRHFAQAALALSFLSLAACSVTPTRPQDPALQVCEHLFERLDQAVEAAGVRDGGEYRPPGFAYLRSNRFFASFASELSAEQLPVWLEHMRQLDLQAREFEIRNLNQPQWQAQWSELERCGQALLQSDLASPQRLQRIRQAVDVPDDYSLLARGLGLYPFAAPFLRLGIQGFQAEIREDYELASEELLASGQWQLWQPQHKQTVAKPDQSLAETDGLGLQQFSKAQLAALFQEHAPSFLIDQQGDYDLPGRPYKNAAGELAFQAQPVVYQKLAWTRFQDRVLPQLVYVVWFAERPPTKSFDSYAGALDGVMWRVTLDERGQALLYDTVHSCGCYHYLFPARELSAKLAPSFWQEMPMQPQAQLPDDKLVLVLNSGDHYLRRVVGAEVAKQKALQNAREWEAESYAELRSQAAQDGHYYSLFEADGLIAGSERFERFWLWPSGVKSPGTMRQWGRHATAFVGRAHFDDPRALEAWFVSLP